MDPHSTYNDLPWELIMSALQGELSPEEEVQFQRWLASSEGNHSTYERLQRLWKEEMADYALYRQVDEVQAWGELQDRMDGERIEEAREPARNARGKVLNMKWAAVAAILLLLVGGEWWLVVRKKGIAQYATAAHEMKQVALPDGTQIGMEEQTQIRVEPGYNTTERKLVLVRGTARFDVVHNTDRPFVVDMGDVSVKDIGTSFTIERTADSIKVQVWEGKVALVRGQTGESREITEGREESFYIAENRFGEVGVRTNGLRFDDQPLSAVVAGLEKAWGKKVVLGDPSLATRRLTVHLEGEGFEDAIKTVCASLNLDYGVENGAYVLRSKE